MLSVENCELRYGPIQAVRGIDLRVAQAQIVAVIGANGAGKSSLLKAIIGLEPMHQGRVNFKGKDISQVPVHKRVSLGITLSPEGRGVFPDQTVMQNLMLGAFSKRYEREELDQILAAQFALFPRLKERANQYAGTLSGGEQQMLAISRALMSSPSLLLLDEPSLGLAPLIVAEILETLRRLREGGLTIVLVEQMAQQALRLADYAYVLDRGRVLISGAGNTLLKNAEVRAAYLGGH